MRLEHDCNARSRACDEDSVRLESDMAQFPAKYKVLGITVA